MCESGTSYYWETAPGNTADLIYTLYFRAKDDATGEVFADYNAQLLVNCLIQQSGDEALQILNLISELHDTVNAFIKSNTAPYTHQLQLHNYEINEHELARMDAGIKRVMAKKPYDEQTDEERLMRQRLKSVINNAKVNTVVSRINSSDK